MKNPEFQQRQIVRVVRVSPGVVILANQDHLNARREGAVGTVVSVTPWWDEHLVWVRHGMTTAPYFSYELTLVGEPCE